MDSDTDEKSWNNQSVDGDEKLWSPKAIKLLLSLYLKNKENFQNPRIRKKVTWLNVLDQMARCGIKGHSVVSIDRKFRNLKKTFFAIRKKKRDDAATTTKWQYYNEMEKIFIDDDFGKTECDNNLTTLPVHHDDAHPPAQLCSIFDFIKEESIYYNEDDSNEPNSESVDNDIESDSKESPQNSQTKDLTRDSRCNNDDLRGIRMALERSNKIQQERNDLIRTYIEHMMKNNKT